MLQTLDMKWPGAAETARTLRQQEVSPVSASDSKPNSTIEQPARLSEQYEFLPGMRCAEYMPIEHAAFILDDMTGGQLDNFDPGQFYHWPDPAVKLAAAALTLFWANGQQGYFGWSDDAMIAMWQIRACLRELAEYVPTAITYINNTLNNEAAPKLYIAKAINLKPGGMKPRPGFVYVLRSSTGAYKIGLARNPQNRLETFTVKLPFEVEYDTLIKTDDMRRLEAELHTRYSHKRINGEWFALDAADLAELRQMGGTE
jgi:hypothetical protein